MRVRCRPRPWALLAVLGLAACCCVTAACRSGQAMLRQQATRDSSAANAPTAKPLVLLDTDVQLARVAVPQADPYALARRLANAYPLPVQTPSSAVTPDAQAHGVGDSERFWVMNLDSVENFAVTATLRHASPHLFMWVEDGLNTDDSGLRRSLDHFETVLYPILNDYFVPAGRAGMISEAQYHILNARFSGALGYFTGNDMFPSWLVPFSNERRMFYINPQTVAPGSTSYDGTLVHEFQHMLHWEADRNEDSWLNEGLSELAMHLCGYDRLGRVQAFERKTDVQLTNWEISDTIEHYGASFLFLAYFAERFGQEAVRELVKTPLNGIASFDAVLHAQDPSQSFEGLFADWTVANYVDGRVSDLGSPYGYQNLQVRANAEASLPSPTSEVEGSVHQYAADYIELARMDHGQRLEFRAPLTTSLIANQPHSGSYYWWSNRGDNSNMTLTRSFDLSGLQSATLQAWLWYDIEEGWDFAYVEASCDDGHSWHLLTSDYTTLSNPSGNSYGPALTGGSGLRADPRQEQGPSDGPQWVLQSFDLTPFVGGEVQLRFEYLTDDSVHGAGLCIDDIAIPELEFHDDVEDGVECWSAEGFLRTDNVVSQRFLVQLVRMAPATDHSEVLERVTVERMILQPAQHSSGMAGEQGGSLIAPAASSRERLAIVVSATAASSTLPAGYRLSVTPIE